ncbi:MAG: hypothetical protein AAF597_15240, partial [Bacteroidota bacterium]
MRYGILSLLLFVTCCLSAQATQFVWAKSGLTLRNLGKSGAEKIGVVPYGASVKLTGEVGERISVPIFSAFASRQYDETEKSLAWDMEDHYVEVIYDGKKGWV